MADYRRVLVGALAVVLLVGWIVASGGPVDLWLQRTPDARTKFIADGAGRVGLVLAGLWLAWPTLRKPAAWIPPGIAVGGVLVMGAVAAQPRLALVLLPAAGMLMTLAAIVKAFRG